MEPSIFKLPVLVRALMFSVVTSTLLNLVNVKITTGADISQTCTRGFPSPADLNHSQQLLPLLGLFGTSFGTEQWIFPDLKFTCRGVVTKWIFIGQGIPESSNCRAQLSTWRLDKNFNTGLTAVYNRVSITDTSKARIIQQNGSVLTYEVATRGIHVQRNDIFGIEIECRSHAFETVSRLNVLGIRDSSRSVASLSYRRSGSGSVIFISPTTRFESNYFPLVEAVMETEKVDDAATTTNGLYHDIITLTNVTTIDTTDHDDQGSQNNTHTYMVGVIIGGGVTFVLFVGVILCTCILLVRQRAKTRKHRQVDQRNATSMCRQELGEFEGSNFSTTATLMARNFAYSSTSCSQTEVDSVRRSCSTTMEENSAYNSQTTDTFNESDGNSGGIPMQANSAYTPVLGESQTLSASYQLNQQNETRGLQSESDAYYDTIDSISYFQGSVYGGTQSEDSVVMENDNKLTRDSENRNWRNEAAHQGRGRCDSMVDCDAYTYSYISDLQSDGYATTAHEDSHRIV